MGYLYSAEIFFFYIGWGLFFLGFISCLFPRCFKKSVLLMLSGDFALVLAILFPKAFVDWRVFSLGFNYKTVGIFGAFVIWAIWIVPSLILLYRRKDVAKGSCENKRQAEAKHLGSEEKAPPSLFSNVRKKSILDSQENTSFFAGIEKEDR